VDWIYQTRDCAPWNSTQPYTLFCVYTTCDSFSSHTRCLLHSSRRSVWLSHLLCLSLGQGEISSFHRVSLVNSNHFCRFTQIITQFPCVNTMENFLSLCSVLLACFLEYISEGPFLSQIKNNSAAPSTGHVQSVCNGSFEVNKLINRK
jgi:hypothetical protein